MNTRRTEEPADREGFIFPENPREKKTGSKTHIILFAPRELQALSTCDTTTLLPLYYTTLLPTPPCTDTVRKKKVAADFNRVSAVVIPKPFDF